MERVKSEDLLVQVYRPWKWGMKMKQPTLHLLEILHSNDDCIEDDAAIGAIISNDPTFIIWLPLPAQVIA